MATEMRDQRTHSDSVVARAALSGVAQRFRNAKVVAMNLCLAQTRRGLFHFLVEVFENRLNRAHDERQAGKSKSDHHPEPRVRCLDTEWLQVVTNPSVGRINCGERDSGDRGG